ncbi:hypothetical protein IFM89_020914 [Coptis chinensis]|uniref:Transcription factor 25 n=1 Tax=Coptis chinensis TaxID=261450 RepID=A0A835HLM1_9MAGN|nr:hypothetical protein IFM89_020914 [Coptis chinensis]
MSARYLKKVLKEQEEQQQLLKSDSQQLNDVHDDSDSSPPRTNPFQLLLDDDDDQFDELENADEPVQMKSTAQTLPPPNRKSKKKKKKAKDGSNSTKDTSGKSIDEILHSLSMDAKSSSRQDASTNAKAENTRAPIAVVVVQDRSAVEDAKRHIPRKTFLVSPSAHWPRWDGSLSMELLETKNGQHFFKYVHTSSYSQAQRAFEAAKAIHDLNGIASILVYHPYHIESLITIAEVLKFSGEHQSSADAIAKCLYALECAWHPMFSPMHGSCQLKYSHDTNRPLFSVLFTHMQNMDRRGCHRSALEVCKLLLSLDPEDPLGAMFCIDYFSLRAEEYSWLERFSEEYRSDNSLWLFPNFSYSLAICRFYLERESCTDSTPEENEKSTSSDLMKQALMLHPLVLKKLVAKAPLKDPAWTKILMHKFFGSAQAGGPSLEHLIEIYVERSYILWRLPDLQILLRDTAQLVTETLQRDGSDAKDWACVRKETFSSERNEYSHLLVSEFSNSVPTMPPDELRDFMIDPRMAQAVVGDGDHGANPEVAARAPREVMNRNGLVVFLESILPWVDYGENEDNHLDGNNRDED